MPAQMVFRLDAFVMGAGTGGCLAGVSLFLREKGCPAKIYLVDPPGSALFNRVRHGVCYSPQMSERDVRKHRCDHNDGKGHGEVKCLIKVLPICVFCFRDAYLALVLKYEKVHLLCNCVLSGKNVGLLVGVRFKVLG